jgi:hypothetical protein
VLANHRTVFAFHQPVVVGVARPRFSLLDQDLSASRPPCG